MQTRQDFPIFSQQAEPPLVYLDSAATALKPQVVIDAVVDVLTRATANIHRSVHRLGDLATTAFEDSRQVVADFIGAMAHEIVFVRNTTEGLNLVARGWSSTGRTLVQLGDHHSNLLPWQNRVTRLTPLIDGRVDVCELERQLAQRDVGVVSISHISNVTGVQNDVRRIAGLCHDHGAILVVDAAQSVPHASLDVFELDCDFLAFSGHKLGAPSGVGVLYGKAEQLERIAWHQQGGATVGEVHADSLVPKDIPWRFEAGTPAIESVVGLGAAIKYLQKISMNAVGNKQRELAKHAVARIREHLPQVTLLGSPETDACGPVSFVQRIVSPHVLARALSDRHNICVRSGFHCAQPLHEFLGAPASLRLSFYHYNDCDEIDLTIAALERLLATSP